MILIIPIGFILTSTDRIFISINLTPYSITISRLKNFIIISFLLISLSIGIGCNTNSKNTNSLLSLNYPAYFPKPQPLPARNPLTTQGVSLGEKLFFDPNLSANKQISCATCHRPELAFSDGKKSSIGHSGKELKRNTPALINLAWSRHFFWDGGVKNLESLSFAALLNPDEMGIDLGSLCEQLNNNPEYKARFKEAFAIDSITSAYISRALAQYLRTLVDAGSRFDSVQLGLASFSALEQKGRIVFDKNCKACHPPPLFTDHDFHHNGLGQEFSAQDLFLTTGRFRITRDTVDLGKYKTPTLRNLAVTAPFMHDGRFGSLDQVLDHYQNIDRANQIQDTLVGRISFSDKERSALKVFLETLNDKSYDQMNFK